MTGGGLRIWAYDPRHGRSHLLDEAPNTGSLAAPQPDDGPDWVWVIDDADANYGPPGLHPLKDPDAHRPRHR